MPIVAGNRLKLAKLLGQASEAFENYSLRMLKPISHIRLCNNTSRARHKNSYCRIVNTPKRGQKT